MKNIDYNYPIFVYDIGTYGLSKEGVDDKIRTIKSEYDYANVNIWFTINKTSTNDEIKCIWQGVSPQNISYDF